jgi:DNA-binding NarL/FixJ family response regulator
MGTAEVKGAEPTTSPDRGDAPVMGARPVRVVVVSQSALLRAGLIQLLSTDPGRVDVVDCADHFDGFDLAVYDLSGADERIADDLSHLLTRRPVIALDPSSRANVIRGALAAGVCAVVPLDTTAKALIETVERAAAGDHDFVEELQRHHRRQLTATYGLTARELGILELIATGIANDEIAKTLWLSINSVKTYIRTAYRKIGVSTRSQAVLWAVQHELQPPPNGSGTDQSPSPAARGTDLA